MVKNEEETVVDTSDLPIDQMTFTVITSLVDPYSMLKDTSVELFGNDRFEGFGIDIIMELAALYGFKYEFIVQEDKHVGSVIDADKNLWDGMIGKVMSGVSMRKIDVNAVGFSGIGTISFFICSYLLQEADLAITDLTINSERITALDFTPSFMNLGVYFFNAINLSLHFMHNIINYFYHLQIGIFQASPCYIESHGRIHRQRFHLCRRSRRSFGYIWVWPISLYRYASSVWDVYHHRSGKTVIRVWKNLRI